MLSSPAKRRKTSDTTAVDASQTNQEAHEKNSRVNVSRRPSFQSQTKASLAKSHPEILARAISRSPTRPPSKGSRHGQGQDANAENAESRVFGLRDRKALRPSMTSTASPIDALKQSPRRQSSGLGAFAAPPRRVSRRIGLSDLTFGTPEAKRQNDTTSRRPEDTPDDQLASELDSATHDMNTDADNLNGGDGGLQEDFEEPDLPPTPTQLGLERLPGRPKELMSSSPTAQYEKRVQQRLYDVIKPSPLKLRSFDGGENLGEVSVETPTTDQGLLSESAAKKQKVKKDLSAELRQMKDDVVQLETWMDKLAQPEGTIDSTDEDWRKLISLLSSDNGTNKRQIAQNKTPISSILSTLLPFACKTLPKPQREPPLPTNPFALKEHAQAKQYLTVFASLNLTTHTTKVSRKQDSMVETHRLTLSAGAPFPSKLYTATVIYETNPETQSLLSIYVPETNEVNIPESLRRWINTRLSDPHLKLDVSGLCWGINRYWEAAISRAQLWLRIEGQHSKFIASRKGREQPNNEQNRETNDGGKLSPPELRRLIPHLNRTSMTFGTGGNNDLRLLLSCTLTLDEWTSEPQLLPEVTVSSTRGKKVEQEAKKLFHMLLLGDKDKSNGLVDSDVEDVDVDGIVRALDGVLGVLFGLDAKSEKGKLPLR